MAHTEHTPARTRTRGFRRVSSRTRWQSGCSSRGVIWFFEKDADLLVCEIRRSADDQPGYEFEIAAAAGPITLRFDTPQELIAKYLREQTRLISEGWRPRTGDISSLE